MASGLQRSSCDALDGLPEADTSSALPVVPRLPAQTLRPLQRVVWWRSWAALASTWGWISGALGLALFVPHPLVWIAAMLVMGRCQHALAVLMHDAAHYRLFENRWWNEWVGQWLCAQPIASNLHAYRTVHLRHHRYLLTERDPDLSLSLPYPCSRESWRRKLMRDLTGISALVMRGYLTVDKKTGRMRLSRGKLLRRWDRPATTKRMATGLAFAGLAWVGYAVPLVVLWVIPLLTVYQVILRIRGVIEHAAVPDHSDELRNARTIVSRNPIARFFLAPHHVSYHLEHHLYPAVPHYHLPQLHAVLRTQPAFYRAYVQTSYRHALGEIVR